MQSPINGCSYSKSITISEKCTMRGDMCYHFVAINGISSIMSKDNIRALAKKRRIKLGKHFDIVKIKLIGGCLGGLPCRHMISVKENRPQTLNAYEICKLYKRFRIEIPAHFKSYA